MEMGQDAVQVSQGEEQHQEATGSTTEEIEHQQQQAFIATSSEQFTQTSQAASLLLSNVVTTSGTEPPASLASILQDVVSGMQSGAGSVPAAIITDPNSGSGSFLIVKLNVVPIVRPVLVSNLPAGGVGGAVSVSAETLQVLTAGLHTVDDGSGGGQETVTVDVGATEAEGRFSKQIYAIEGFLYDLEKLLFASLANTENIKTLGVFCLHFVRWRKSIVQLCN